MFKRKADPLFLMESILSRPMSVLRMFIFLPVLVQLWFHSVIPCSENSATCFTTPPDKTHKEYRLTNHLIASWVNTPLFNCFMKCTLDCKCVSLNWEKDGNLCELNDEVAENVTVDFIKDGLFTYLGVHVEKKECSDGPREDLCCLSNPCMNGGTCTELYSGQRRFTCTCPVNYSGKYCESLIDSCSRIYSLGIGKTDGNYTMYPSLYPDFPIQVFCYDMSGTRKTYINVSPETNFAHFDPRRYFSIESCNGNLYIDTTYAKACRTKFSKIRISTGTLQVMNGDRTFAVSNGSNIAYYATAGDYHGKTNCHFGHFMMDVRGTCLRFRESIEWIIQGSPVGIIQVMNLTWEEQGAVVSAWCGGYPGGCKPNSTTPVVLEPIPGCIFQQ